MARTTHHRSIDARRNGQMRTPTGRSPARQHTHTLLWIIIVMVACGVFLAGMLGTGLALAT